MNALKIILIAGLLILLACSGNIQFAKFEEPFTDESIIVIGHILVEDNQFTRNVEVHNGLVQAILLGKTASGERLGIYVDTDENGYFAASNLPRGEYALKGIHLTFRTGESATVVNPLRHDESIFEYSNSEHFVFDGDYFPYAPKGQVVSLQNHIFRFNNPFLADYPVKHWVAPSYKEIKLVDDTVISRPPVEDYFIKRYPESKWMDAWQESVKIIRLPREQEPKKIWKD